MPADRPVLLGEPTLPPLPTDQELPPATGPESGAQSPASGAAPTGTEGGGTETSTQADGGTGANDSAGSPFSSLWIFGLLFVFMWLFVIRPERKRQKERAAMLGAVQKGDKVVTSGGLHGTVTRLDEKTFTLKVDEQVRMKFDRNAIARIASSKGAAGGDADADEQGAEGAQGSKKKKELAQT